MSMTGFWKRSARTCYELILPIVVVLVSLMAMHALFGFTPLVLIVVPVAWSTTSKGLPHGLMSSCITAYLVNVVLVDPLLTFRAGWTFTWILAACCMSACL